MMAVSKSLKKMFGAWQRGSYAMFQRTCVQPQLEKRTILQERLLRVTVLSYGVCVLAT